MLKHLQKFSGEKSVFARRCENILLLEQTWTIHFESSKFFNETSSVRFFLRENSRNIWRKSLCFSIETKVWAWIFHLEQNERYILKRVHLLRKNGLDNIRSIDANRWLVNWPTIQCVNTLSNQVAISVEEWFVCYLVSCLERDTRV